MKLIAAIFISLLPVVQGFSQITITSSDMPSAGDTFRVSNGLILPTIDPVPTGSGFTWDFSALQWISQDVDSFISVASTGPVYSIVFIDFILNPYRANLAARGPNLPSLPQVSISDVNYFYYNSSASYQVSGYGALINSLPVPIPFNNKDRIYSFPLDFGDEDSSDSDFQLSLPGLGFYGHDQHRVNEADGWGTLITPYGTFDALRVKSTITGNDSLFLDTLGFGFGFALPQTIEYKWLGDQQGIPLLQINTTVSPLGTETITSIRYRDSVRVLTGIADQPVAAGHFSVSVYPNPVQETFVMDVNMSGDDKVKIVIFNSLGEIVADVWSGKLQQGTSRISFNAAQALPASGLYFIETRVRDQRNQTPFIFTAE